MRGQAWKGDIYLQREPILLIMNWREKYHILCAGWRDKKMTKLTPKWIFRWEVFGFGIGWFVSEIGTPPQSELFKCSKRRAHPKKLFSPSVASLLAVGCGVLFGGNWLSLACGSGEVCVVRCMGVVKAMAFLVIGLWCGSFSSKCSCWSAVSGQQSAVRHLGRLVLPLFSFSCTSTMVVGKTLKSFYF